MNLLEIMPLEIKIKGRGPNSLNLLVQFSSGLTALEHSGLSVSH